jgi:hypothetical protein
VSAGDTPSPHDGRASGEAGTRAGPVDELFGQMTAAAAKAMKSYRQGDVLEDLAAVVIVGPSGEPVEVAAPLGVVVVSQTC